MPAFADLVFKEYEQEVLQQLLQRPDDSFTVNEIAKQSSASYNTVKSFLRDLGDYSIVRFEQKGNSRLVSYNHESRYHDLLTDIFTVDTSTRREQAAAYADRLYSEHGDEIESIILFGSAARGAADRDSDIDVLILKDGTDTGVEDHAIGIRGERDAFNDIVPVFQTTEQFRNNLIHGDRFEQNVKRDGIVLAGKSIQEIREEQ